jgi:hypothetical protein
MVLIQKIRFCTDWNEANTDRNETNTEYYISIEYIEIKDQEIGFIKHFKFISTKIVFKLRTTQCDTTWCIFNKSEVLIKGVLLEFQILYDRIWYILLSSQL